MLSSILSLALVERKRGEKPHASPVQGEVVERSETGGVVLPRTGTRLQKEQSLSQLRCQLPLHKGAIFNGAPTLVPCK